MKTAYKYSIRHSGLSLGEHRFTFPIESGFMEMYGYEPMSYNLNVDVVMNKLDRMMELNFHISGEIQVLCDRCNEEMNYPIAGTNRIFIKYGNTFREESDEMYIIPEDSGDYDLGPLLYEFIVLAIPYRFTHPIKEDGMPDCNPEALKWIQNYSTQEKETDLQTINH